MYKHYLIFTAAQVLPYMAIRMSNAPNFEKRTHLSFQGWPPTCNPFGTTSVYYHI